MRLVVATRNAAKLREIRSILRDAGIDAVGLEDLPSPPRVAEDGTTFLENARKKAHAVVDLCGVPVLADDSGLSVEALGGKPGVLSARYAGPDASDDDNNRKLLRDLGGVGSGCRGAAFVCAMVLVTPDHREWASEGKVDGRILESPRGIEGFGYDPLFFVESAQQTLAEMDLEAKNRLSHRARALRQLLPQLASLAAVQSRG